MARQYKRDMGKSRSTQIMTRILSIITILVWGISLHAQLANPWTAFEEATWRDEYIEEYFSYATLLDYDDHAKSIEGKTVTLKGHYIPVMDEEIIILSKYAYANCFFCGGAGLESVVEIRLKEKAPRKFELDEKLTFKGKLRLNTTEWEFVSFILEDAVIVE